MFGFLKDKLKKAVNVFTKATVEEAPQESTPEKPAGPKQPQQAEKKPSKPQEQKQPEKKPAPKKTDKVEKEQLKKAEKNTLAQKGKTNSSEKEKLRSVELESKAEKKPLPTATKAQPLPVPIEQISLEEAEEAPEDFTIEDELAEQEMHEAVRASETPAQTSQTTQSEKSGFFGRIFGKKTEATKSQETPSESVQAPTQQKPEEKTIPEQTGGFFGKLKAAVTTKKLDRAEFDTIFEELEIGLLESNVALEVVDKLKDDLWEAVSGERFSRFSPEKRVQAALKQSIEELFMEPFDILAQAKQKDVYIICAVGINGSGKTTTLAKLCQYFKDNGLEPVLAAGDTFRAAAIQQLEEHANKIGVKIIKQQYGADAAAVAFDAVQYARSGKARVVLIDTAGRLHSNTNLMEELKKIVRVAKPDCTLFIGEATTGNDCIEQAVQFQEAVDIDGIILSKVDVDERGGAALSISYVTKKPILFFGTGQTYKDLQPFNRETVIASLDLT